MCWYLANALKESSPLEDKKSQSKYYVDAAGQIVGRMCSRIAKLLLSGNSVVVVNAEKALFSGHRSNVMGDFLDKLKIASVVHPKHGPFHPRTPSGILTRTVRGMIPRTKPRGMSAMKRLRVYEEIPEGMEKMTFTIFDEAKATKPLAYYVPLGEVAERIGWKTF